MVARKVYARCKPLSTTSSGRGNGPIAGYVDALAKNCGVTIKVRDYHQHAAGAGSDATAVSYIEAETGDGLATESSDQHRREVSWQRPHAGMILDNAARAQHDSVDGERCSHRCKPSMGDGNPAVGSGRGVARHRANDGIKTGRAQAGRQNLREEFVADIPGSRPAAHQNTGSDRHA